MKSIFGPPQIAMGLLNAINVALRLGVSGSHA